MGNAAQGGSAKSPKGPVDGSGFSAAGQRRKPALDAAIGVALMVGVILSIVFGRLASADGIIEYEFTADPGERAAEFDSAVWADFGFIVGYVLLLGALGAYVWSRSFTRNFREATAVLIGALIVAALADVGEDIALLLDNSAWSAPLATVKWVLIIPTLLLVPAAVFVFARGRLSAGWLRRNRSHLSEAAEVFARPADAESEQEYRWLRGYWAPTVADPTKVDTQAICLSGGGIRAGSVALGALQVFSGDTDGEPTPDDGRNLLAETDYIISVSGGGYLAGAFLQASHLPETDAVWSKDDVQSAGAPSADAPAAPPPAGAPTASPPAGDQQRISTASGVVTGIQALPITESFKRGSVEYAKLRSRASYIADSPAELLTALALVAKNMLLSLATLFAPAALLGVALGILYARIPLAAVSITRPDPLSVDADRFTTDNFTAAILAIGAAGITAVVTLAVAGVVESVWADKAALLRAIPWLTRWAQALGGTAIVLALATLGIPLAMQIVSGAPGGAAAPATGVVALNYVAVLAAILWRRRAGLGSLLAKLRGQPDGPPKAVPRGAFQLLLVVVTLAALTLAWLVTVAAVAAWIYQRSLPGSERWLVVGGVAAGIAFVTAVLAGFDVTSTSLHPFYRKRLARAFALRRVVREDQTLRAMAYPPTEGTGLTLFDGPRRTELDSTATVVDRRGGTARSGDAKTPAFVFAAAASVGGDDKPAGGQNAVSYCFSADYVGGPDLGWMPTTSLAAVSRTRIQRDLTVQAAVAISGAAFASAMGRAARGYQTLLAVSGARLGSWLPNPRFLFQSQYEDDNPAWPHGMPSYRGMSYLGREVFGLNSGRGRLVQVTDGGHYENLGVVEALRRRCTTIVAIDASGDAPPNLTTFAEAIRLARAELGVRFDENATTLLELANTDTAGPVRLANRLFASSIVTVGFTYPEVAGGKSGTLILAKAALTPDLPPWLLTYADNDPVFPHDSTSDQWFNEGQFAAYTELGRQIGARAVEALETASPSG